MIKQKLLSSNEFEDLAYEKMRPGKNKNRVLSFRTRRFRSWFGTDSFIVSLIWKMLHFSGWLSKTNKPNPFHLFWALNFLKNYETESVCAAKFDGVDEKTLRKWVWFYISGISQLASKVVSQFNRINFVQFLKNLNLLLLLIRLSLKTGLNRTRLKGVYW